jgi:hypothetical protein
MDDYRVTTRGGSTYLMPKVGAAWTKARVDEIRSALRSAGYFVSLISPGRMAVAETAESPSIDVFERHF